MMGEGKPIRLFCLAPLAVVEIINNRQFSGLFDAGLTALALTSDVSATFVFFNCTQLEEARDLPFSDL